VGNLSIGKINGFAMSTEEEAVLLKLILIGDSGVGKSNLISQFVDGIFNAETPSTCGVEIATRLLAVNNQLVKAQLWDTAGQERYAAITRAYYRGTKGGFLVYDVSLTSSFTNLGRWLKEIRDNAGDVPLMLLANKADVAGEYRAVSMEEGQAFATKENIGFMEVSAANGTNVNDAFGKLIGNVLGMDDFVTLNLHPSRPGEGTDVAVAEAPKEDKKGCC
jgi:small GTP-binding protein